MQLDRAAFLALTAALSAAACTAPPEEDDAESTSEAVVSSCPAPGVTIDARFYGYRAPAPAHEGYDDETPLARHYARFFGDYESTSLYKSLKLTNKVASPAFAGGKLMFELRAIRQYLGRPAEVVEGYWFLHYGYGRELSLAFVAKDATVDYAGRVRTFADNTWLEYPTGGLRIAGTSYRRVGCDGGPVDPPSPPPDAGSTPACNTSWATPTNASMPDAFSEDLVGTWTAEGTSAWFRRIELRREAFRSVLNPSARPVYRFIATRADGRRDQGYYRPDDFLAPGTGHILFYAEERAFDQTQSGQAGPGRCHRYYTLTRSGCTLTAKSGYVGPNAEPLLTFRKEGCTP